MKGQFAVHLEHDGCIVQEGLFSGKYEECKWYILRCLKSRKWAWLFETHQLAIQDKASGQLVSYIL